MSEVVIVEYEIPDGTVDAGYVVVYQYLDGDGELYYGAVSSDDLSYLGTLGLLEGGKLRISQQVLSDPDNEVE
jgi:hypothetical protein